MKDGIYLVWIGAHEDGIIYGAATSPLKLRRLIESIKTRFPDIDPDNISWNQYKINGYYKNDEWIRV